MELTDSCCNSLFNFLRISILFSMMAVSFFIFILTMHKGSDFSTSLPTFVTCGLFENNHSVKWASQEGQW